MSYFCKILIIISLLFTTSYAGIFKDAAKGAAVYGIVKVGASAIKHFPENKFFKTKKDFKGHDVYQRDVDPELNIQRKHQRTGETIEETNMDRMEKGKPPYIDKDGKIEPIELHHSRQQGDGPFFEVSKSTHGNSAAESGGKALHPYGNEKNPYDPVDRKAFDKDRMDYWKERAKDFYSNIKEKEE
jgi:hypothetical protein